MADRTRFEGLLCEMGWVPPRQDTELHGWLREKFQLDPGQMTDAELAEFADLRMEKELDAEAERRMAESAQRRLEDVPPIYRDLTAQDFGFIPRTFSRIMQGLSCIITGPRGCGKSALAWTVFSELARRGEWSVAVVDVRDLLAMLKQAVYGRDLTPEQAVRERWGRGLQRLFIDEVGKMGDSEADFSLFGILADYRYKWRLQTVCLANEPLDKVRQRMGESAYARLTSDGAEAIAMPPNNFRRRQDG